MPDTVKILVARTYTVHAADPARTDHFLCKAGGSQYGPPVVVVGRPDDIPVEEFLALSHACKNCKKRVAAGGSPVDPDTALAALEASPDAEPTPEHAAEVARRLTSRTARMILDMAAQDDRSLTLATDYPSPVRRSADRYGLVYPVGFGDHRLTPLGELVAKSLAERTRATQAQATALAKLPPAATVDHCPAEHPGDRISMSRPCVRTSVPAHSVHTDAVGRVWTDSTDLDLRAGEEGFTREVAYAWSAAHREQTARRLADHPRDTGPCRCPDDKHQCTSENCRNNPPFGNAPLTVEQAGEKISAEYGEALATLGAEPER